MAVIADFEHYPDWVDSMKSAEVLTSVAGRAKTVRMVLDHTLVKDSYVLAYEWKPHAVSWKLIEEISSRRWTVPTCSRPTAPKQR